jgi:hypothetical protein
MLHFVNCSASFNSSLSKNAMFFPFQIKHSFPLCASQNVFFNKAAIETQPRGKQYRLEI